MDIQARFELVRDVVEDLAAAPLGTAEQKANALRSLWDTYMSHFITYALFGDTQIITDIQNDSTHTWLDNVVGSKAIRQHIVDRLS